MKLKITGLFILFTILSLLIFESYTQSYLPNESILYFLHENGILLEYDIAFSPSKGFWFDLGYLGTFLFLIMMCYPMQANIPFLKNYKNRAILFNIHVLCGILGAILITFHTTFKQGGIASLCYWTMAALALSGIYGKIIYSSKRYQNSSKNTVKKWLMFHKPLAAIMFSTLFMHIVSVYLFKV